MIQSAFGKKSPITQNYRYRSAEVKKENFCHNGTGTFQHRSSISEKVLFKLDFVAFCVDTTGLLILSTYVLKAAT